MTKPGERDFLFGNVLEVKEVPGLPDQPAAQSAAVLSQPEGAFKRDLELF